MARIPLPTAEQFADEVPDFATEMDLDRLNITRALGNNPAAWAAAMEYVNQLYEQLPATLREVAILSVAREAESTYEWHQHVRMAQQAGLPLETIRAIGAEDHDTLEPVERAIVEFVRAQVAGTVTDAEFDALAGHFDDADIVAISRLAGHYRGTADFIAAMDLELEEPFVGWVPEA